MPGRGPQSWPFSVQIVPDQKSRYVLGNARFTDFERKYFTGQLVFLFVMSLGMTKYCSNRKETQKRRKRENTRIPTECKNS
jgi:hypothetical protein